MCLIAWCGVKGPHAHFPIYRPYVRRLAHYAATEDLEWKDVLAPLAETWVRHAQPWYEVRGRAFTNRATTFNGVVPVEAWVEANVDDVQSRLHRELYVFLLNRLIDSVLVERRHRQNGLRAALQAVRLREDVP